MGIKPLCKEHFYICLPGKLLSTNVTLDQLSHNYKTRILAQWSFE